MAIINNNVQNVKFLRNGSVFTPSADPQKTAREVALAAMNTQLDDLADGTAILGRYQESNGTVKTLVGFAYVSGDTKTLTVFDVEGASADVEALRQEINAKLGTDFISSGNTVEANLTALSGGTFTPGTSQSADTSVEGAKAYAYDLLGTLDYTDTAETGSYVSKVDQVDGKITTTKVALPSSADTAVAKKVVIAVSEDKGQIEVTRGEISSSAETMVLTDNADGGVNFEVNIDNNTIIQDADTKKLKVADAALVQYEGDTKTIAISPVQDGVRTVSSIITLSSITPSSTTVKEEYALKNASGETIGSTIKIYKDSSLVSITYITNPSDTHYQNLEYVYIDASGNTQTEYVDMSSLVLEAEFASGLTIENHVARGVVDPESEVDSENAAFLTVGADGFKISGIKDEIDRQLDAVVEGLDATVTGETANQHISISIEELDGKLVQSGLTITESNIANADDLEELSAKTVTNITSTNSSINITTAKTSDGTVEVDMITDADKIQMSGFSADNASALSGIAESDSIATAFEKTNTVITENERVTAEALTNLDGRLDVIESGYVETVKVNNVALAESNNAVNVQISSTAASGAESSPIIVNTDNSTGAVTLQIQNIDCGTY